MAELGRSRMAFLLRRDTDCRAELFFSSAAFCFCFTFVQLGRVSLQRLWMVTLQVGHTSASLAVMLLLQAKHMVMPDTEMVVKRCPLV